MATVEGGRGVEMCDAKLGDWRRFRAMIIHLITPSPPPPLLYLQVYRVSFSVSVFFAVLVFLSLLSEEIHLGYWLPKTLFLAAMLVVSFEWIASSFFWGYATYARVVSAVFLLLQAVAMLDFAYWVHEELLQRIEGEGEMDEGASGLTQLFGTPWRAAYSVLSAALVGATITGIALLYKVMGSLGACPSEVALCSVTLVLCVLMVALSSLDCLSPPNAASRGALVPLIVAAYAVLQLATAFYANPNDECNPSPQSGQPTLSLAATFVVALITLAWSVQSASAALPGLFDNSSSANQADEGDEADSAGAGDGSDQRLLPMPQPPRTSPRATTYQTPSSSAGASPSASAKLAPLPAADPEAADQASQDYNNYLETTRASDEAADDAETARRSGAFLHNSSDGKAWTFYLVMLMGAGYLAMLLTQWKTPEEDSTTAFTASSKANFGVKLGSLFAVVLLFFWTIFAPLWCPDRDFSNRAAE
jgi:Serine incorporator (Serinc)